MWKYTFATWIEKYFILVECNIKNMTTYNNTYILKSYYTIYVIQSAVLLHGQTGGWVMMNDPSLDLFFLNIYNHIYYTFNDQKVHVKKSATYFLSPIYDNIIWLPLPERLCFSFVTYLHLIGILIYFFMTSFFPAITH